MSGWKGFSRPAEQEKSDCPPLDSPFHPGNSPRKHVSMPLPEDTAYFAAAAAGGVAGTVVNKSTDTAKRKLAEGFVGALVAIFCGPTIAVQVGAHEPRDIITCGFVTAACGYAMLTALVDLAKRTGLSEWLQRFGVPKPPPQ